MPFLLIKITWPKWYTDVPWLPPEDLQAVALFDLRFSDNMLSVWKIEDDQSNVDRVVAALAANRPDKNIENFDYALVEEPSVLNLNIKMVNHPGTTPDDGANREWHYNLIELSVSKIVALAHLIRKYGQFKRLLPSQVKDLLLRAVRDGHITLEHLPEKLRTTLQRLIQANSTSQKDH